MLIHLSIRWSLCILAFLLATSGRGAHPWFSTRTAGQQARPVMARPEYLSAFRALRGADPKGPAAVTNGVFDMVISLYNSPPGDDDGNTQGKPGSESQDAYEYILQYFADAVYESTEGKHSIGRVRIYRGGQLSEADVIWNRSGGPAAEGHLNNESKVGFIKFYDIFNAHDFTNNMAEHEAGGYTLAHEWGHYAYGLLDEYCIKAPVGWSNLSATNKVKPSIMNHQWSAAGRNYEWLNFSIPNQGHTIDADFAPFENRRQSAQHQAYEQSCWETLSANSAGDPVNTPYQDKWRGHYGTRVYYPELITVAPSGTNPPRIDLSSTDNPASLPSRRELNVIWMSTNVAVELMIDRSGSMLDSLDHAKAAAKVLLDQAPTGTAVGIISFSITPTVESPVLVISNETTRAALKTAVDDIPGVDFESGSTAIGDAAMRGLSELLSFTQSNVTCVAFIISDGENNYGTDPLDVISEYQRANVPVMGISIGELTDCLRIMAEETGGRPYLSADGQLSSITSAMREALALASGRKSLGQGKFIFDDLVAFGASGSRSAARHYSIPILTDASLIDLKVSVTYSNAVTVMLQKPDGSPCAPVLTNMTRVETQLFFNVAAPAAGEWKITGMMDENSSMQYTVDSGVNSMTYHLRAWSTPSPGVTYVHFPYPLEIFAHLQKERPVNGAVVTANLFFQYPTLTSNIDIALTSIGNGYYRASIPNPYWADYKVTVRADNSAGTACMTSEGILPAPLPDGTLPDIEPDAPISENFVRYDTYFIEAVGCDANEDAPMAPIFVNATAGTFDDCVRLRWYDMNLNFRHIAQYFEVWRSTDPQMAGAVKIGQATYPESQYFDTNVVPGTVYYYTVRASNPVRASEFAPECMGYAAGQGAAAPWLPVAADFDGDRKADPGIYHPATGAWKVWLSGAGYAALLLPDGFLGGNGHEPVAADFDGDRKADPAAYQRQKGDWLVRLSSASYSVSVFPQLMGNSSWVPSAGDWDGDRLADPSLFCDATGEMRARLSSAGYASFQQQMFYWDAGMIPLGADWDGDRFDDPAACEVPTGYWEIKLSGSTYNGIPTAQLWRYLVGAGSLPLAADFDGDGLADPAAYNLSTGIWQLCLSASGYATTTVRFP